MCSVCIAWTDFEVITVWVAVGLQPSRKLRPEVLLLPSSATWNCKCLWSIHQERRTVGPFNMLSIPGFHRKAEGKVTCGCWMPMNQHNTISISNLTIQSRRQPTNFMNLSDLLQKVMPIGLRIFRKLFMNCKVLHVIVTCGWRLSLFGS